MVYSITEYIKKRCDFVITACNLLHFKGFQCIFIFTFLDYWCNFVSWLCIMKQSNLNNKKKVTPKTSFFGLPIKWSFQSPCRQQQAANSVVDLIQRHVCSAHRWKKMISATLWITVSLQTPFSHTPGCSSIVLLSASITTITPCSMLTFWGRFLNVLFFLYLWK